MPKPSMGYLLPAGDAYESDLQCMILFYPDRKEYRQALFGSLDYLATWLAWERDAEKRGQDAARSWRAAVLATRECIEMGTCDTMLDLLTLIEANTRACWCAGEEDFTEGEQYSDVVLDGEGDVPQNIIDAGYAADAADWDGFFEYKCMISHVMITNMEWQLREMLPHMDSTGRVIGGVATIAAVLAVIVATGGSALVLSIILGVAVSATVASFLLELGDVGTEALADAVASDHEELACAIYNSDGSAAALVDLKAKIDELYSSPGADVLKNLNLGPQLKGLYAGRYDQQDIAERMADNGYDVGDYDCTCIETPAAPAGYHLEHPVYDTFTNYLNVASQIINYTESSGLLEISVTAGGGGNIEFMNLFDDIDAAAPFFHGYVWELIDNVSICDFFAVYNGRLDTKADSSTDGESFAGYNTNQHSGSVWDDWTALFDYTGNHSENGMDGIRQRNVVNNCAGYGATHTFEIRVWAVVED